MVHVVSTTALNDCLEFPSVSEGGRRMLRNNVWVFVEVYRRFLDAFDVNTMISRRVLFSKLTSLWRDVIFRDTTSKIGNAL